MNAPHILPHRISRSLSPRPRKALDAPEEDLLDSDSFDAPLPRKKKNSIKARRRLGVSNLGPLPLDLECLNTASSPTVASSTDEKVVDDEIWHLALKLRDIEANDTRAVIVEDDEDAADSSEIFDFPLPPSSFAYPTIRRTHSSASSISSSSGSLTAWSPSTSVTSLHSRPSEGCASPPPRSGVLRCKTIRPLAISKREPPASPSPVALSSPMLPLSSTLRPPRRAPPSIPLPVPPLAYEDEADEFYATDAGRRLSVNPAESLPESVLSPIEAAAPFPFPHSKVVILKRMRSSSLTDVPNFSRPTSLARSAVLGPAELPAGHDIRKSQSATELVEPPPWSPRSRDTSGDIAAAYRAYAPLLLSPVNGHFSLDTVRPSVATILPTRDRAPRASIPTDINEEDWEDYQTLDRSMSPSSTLDVDFNGTLAVWEQQQTRLSLATPEQEQTASPPPSAPSPISQESEISPILRSRWSASTLASVRTRSSSISSTKPVSPVSAPKTFSFTRRYFAGRASKAPSVPPVDEAPPTPPLPSLPKPVRQPRPILRPIGAVTILPPPPPRLKAPKQPKAKQQKMKMQPVVRLDFSQGPLPPAWTETDPFASPSRVSPASYDSSFSRRRSTLRTPVDNMLFLP
ncbi:unnamed protein product [Mycena citricolor]|uniref:Uncharacterized protein n=1 Tax=Mycena citricolor TaxID=2018698 RepID=A0AAD2HW63_9AGAR|nr:unnamed protein product [Mycena citricolor]